jgi:diacylglycerol kinase (ATP)
MTDRPPARRLLIIFNPTCGWRRRRRFAAVLSRLRARGCQATVLETAAPGDAERLAAAADPGRYDLLVVAGGDGTINEAINGLGDRRLPLAILPLGTANVLAAELGLGADPDAIARTIVLGVARPVTVGIANGRRFVLMAGAGFDALVVATVNLDVKRRLGKAAYALAILRQLLVCGFPGYRVTLDGVAHEAASVLVANAHFYGGRFVAAPAADLQSPSLEVGLFERSGRAAAIGYALALLLGWLRHLKSYRVLAARRIEIEGPAGEPVQADGDVIARLPVVIEALPAALELVFPPGRGQPEALAVGGRGSAPACPSRDLADQPSPRPPILAGRSAKTD